MRKMALALLLALGMPSVPANSAQAAVAKEAFVSGEAKGKFEVKVLQVSGPDDAIGRYSLDKTYQGDLVASGTGQMMGSSEPSTQADVYVAIEKVTGTLNGRKGSFLLAQRGTRSAHGQDLNIVIVPGSGTDSLSGISGDLEIIIAGGEHSYILRYTLPSA